MSFRSDIVYRYDGSFEGMICCVHDAFYRKEEPFSISGPDDDQISLLDCHIVETEPDNAGRVMAAVSEKIGEPAADLVRQAYLTCMAAKELAVLRFLRLGFKVGSGVTDMLAEDAVNGLVKAVRSLNGEAHLLTGFIRFSDYRGKMAAVISPKNTVLPIIAGHFCDRYASESFIIYDDVHNMALCYHNGKCELMNIKDFTLPAVSNDEIKYRALWKKFYDTIGIKERYNPKCRMSHMPKRYWKHMTEFQEVGHGMQPAITHDK